MPRIGLLSDSHGQARVTQQAVQLLLGKGVTLLLHLGDVGTIEVIDALLTEVPARLVFGNTDYEADSLGRYARDVGIGVDHPVGRVELNGKSVVFMHGHDPGAMKNVLDQRAAYLCHGHTHMTIDRRVGSTRIINPGALHRAGELTVATLDTEADQVAFYSLAKA